MIDAGTKSKRSLLRRQEQEVENEEAAEGGRGSEMAGEEPASPSGGIEHPFAQYGMTIQPMRDGQAVENEGICSIVACRAGEPTCIAAYNYPEDWSRQHDCAEGVTLRLTLCG